MHDLIAELSPTNAFQQCFSKASFWAPSHRGDMAFWAELPLICFIIDRLLPACVVDVGERLDDACVHFDAATFAFAPMAKHTVAGVTLEPEPYALVRERARASLIIGESPIDVAARYPQGSVDLLRIRGPLTPALRRAWSPALSEKALIICEEDHSSPRIRNSFSLSARHGSVVLAPSDATAIAPLLAAKAAHQETALLQAYARLGEAKDRHASSDIAVETTAVTSRISALEGANDRDFLERSGLFNRDWYLRTYADIAAAGIDPLSHYINHGGFEGRDPGPLFSSNWYLRNNPDMAATGVNPLVHYARHGGLEGRDPHPLFDARTYQARYPASAGVAPLVHYILEGAERGYDPNPCFDGDYYVARNTVVLCDGETPLEHYIRQKDYNRTVHPLFNAPLYKLRHPDWAPSGLLPLAHFLRIGQIRKYTGYDPSLLLIDTRAAVSLHIETIEAWPEISERLANIPTPYDLYVSHPANERRLPALVRRDFPAAAFTSAKTAAEGFLSHLEPLMAKGYQAVCRLHTTQTGQHAAVERKLALDGVLGGVSLVRSILGYFTVDASLGVVAPLAFHASRTATQQIERRVVALLEALYPDSGLQPGNSIFEGGMVWLNPRLLQRLALSTTAQKAFADKRLPAEAKDEILNRLISLLPEYERMRVGVTASGRASDPNFVDVQRAPVAPAAVPISEFIAELAEDLAKTNPRFKISKHRTWARPAEMTAGVNLIGPVKAINGLGVSARGYVASVQKAGVEINVVPWTPGFERVKTQTYKTPSSVMQPINLIHLNLDLLTDARLLDVAPLDRIVVPERYNIAIVYWELMSIRPEWLETISRFDEIWVASEFIRKAIAAVSKTPVYVVRPSVQLESAKSKKTRADFGLPEDRTVFFYGADAGSTAGRKNPQAFWRAYCEEFKPEDGAYCAIKLHYGSHNSSAVAELQELALRRPDVMLIDKTLSADDMGALFKAIDCYVSPQRSEGLGLTVIEAMYAGKPVISTRYGGVADFVTSETAFVAEHRLIEVGAGSAPYPETYLWADPQIASLRACMRDVFEHPDKTVQITENAKARVEALFSLDETSAAISAHLKRIWSAGAGTNKRATNA